MPLALMGAAGPSRRHGQAQLWEAFPKTKLKKNGGQEY